jgi:phosphoglycolate phosphatase
VKVGFSEACLIREIGRSLEEMKRAGLGIYLATSKRVTFASRILEQLEFATYFDGIYGSVPGGELDHKPELLAYILSKHNISPSRKSDGRGSQV